MKTAMQELIEIIKDKRKESDISNTLLRFCQVEAEKLLEAEKQQIIEAHAVGRIKECSGNNTDGYDYYNETFNQSISSKVNKQVLKATTTKEIKN